MPISTFELDRISDKPKTGPLVPPFCVNCGYDLTGSPSDRCPECGTTFVAKEWRRRAGEVSEDIHEIGRANQAATIGVRIGMVALLLAVAEQLLLQDLPGLRLAVGWMALTTGTISFFLGLGPMRVKKLPAWAESLALQRDMMAGLWSVTLGVAAIGFSLF
ncbi:MAG: hypothetical protein ACPGXK_05145 [Phycisphaerae bacterium]